MSVLTHGQASTEEIGAGAHPHRPDVATASGGLAALGIVFGDLGTSPLYAFDTAIKTGVVTTEPASVLGFLSCIVWSLVIVVGIWYARFIMRADNRGEGGIFALIALAQASAPKMLGFIAVLGTIGAALFYGDAVITPAISVLSAVEGLAVIEPHLHRLVVPLALVILVGLFAVQKGGASKIGVFFGPIMLVWFATLGGTGLWYVVQMPSIVSALNPIHALAFLGHSGFAALAILSVVVLAVTGAEALYADMGHVGRANVRLAFVAVVLPCLVLNYLGQGAHALIDPVNGTKDTFFHLVAPWAQPFLVVLATVATVIASQAVISGAFSITSQAAHLGYVPRVRSLHTSEHERGQVYLPATNFVLLVSVVAIVVLFGSSEKLAEAYGFAVTGTMVVTSLLAYIVARGVWKWSAPKAILTVSFFLLFDVSFFIACATKIPDGAWLPLSIGIVLVFMMVVWRHGRRLLAERRQEEGVPLTLALRAVASPRTARVDGTAVYLNEDPDQAPRAFLHNLKHNRVAHRTLVFLTIRTAETPHAPFGQKLRFESLGEGVTRVTVTFGFMETPDIPAALAECVAAGCAMDLSDPSYFVSRAHLVPGKAEGPWRHVRVLFTLLQRNQTDPAEYFAIPPGKVVELGVQIAV